jgi:hypothetical protein
MKVSCEKNPRGCKIEIEINGCCYTKSLSTKELEVFKKASVAVQDDMIADAKCTEQKKRVPSELGKVTEYKADKDVILKKIMNKLSIKEMTTSASSGAFETPFAVSKQDMKTLENLKEHKMRKQITLEQIEQVIKATLIQEEVYSEKPIEEKGKQISSKNIQQPKGYKTSPSGKNTEKSGKESKSDVDSRTKKVNASTKNNLKDKQVEKKSRTQTADERIEAHQNGMEDITYDSISDNQKKKNKEAIEKGGKVGEQMVSDAKKRKESKDKSEVRKAKVFGKDVEFAPNIKDDKKNGKDLAFENTLKKYTFKKLFKNETDMISKIPSKCKVNENQFFVSDGLDTYKILWEGGVNGLPTIMEHKNPVKRIQLEEKFKKIANIQEQETKQPVLNENEMFKTLLNASRNK